MDRNINGQFWPHQGSHQMLSGGSQDIGSSQPFTYSQDLIQSNLNHHTNETSQDLLQALQDKLLQTYRTQCFNHH